MPLDRVVHLVDDEESIRRSVAFLLRAAGHRVEVWASGVEFLKAARYATEGCVLLDVRMPVMDGLQVQKALHDCGIAMPVIVFTAHGDIAIAVQAMRAGAIDFVEKPFERATLLAAVSMAFDKLDDAQAHRERATDATVRIAALTPREQDVLRGMADGLPNKTIAYDLGISPRTVEVHRANLMSKLDVHSLSDALRLAFAAGIGSASA